MSTPDPRPAGETALTDEQVARIIGEVEARVGMGHGAWDMVKPGELVEGFRAALIADAPVVWVATDANNENVSRLFYGDAEMRDGVARNDNEDDGLWLWGHPALTPPGACVRYRLVPDPEET